MKVEVFQVLKQSDEVYDLSRGTFGCPQAERLDSGPEVTEVWLGRSYGAGDVQSIYLIALDVG